MPAFAQIQPLVVSMIRTPRSALSTTRALVDDELNQARILPECDRKLGGLRTDLDLAQ